MSPTVRIRRLPKDPLGWDIAKSSDEKLRDSINAAANASPIDNVAVVLAVGARLRGQASLPILIWI